MWFNRGKERAAKEARLNAFETVVRRLARKLQNQQQELDSLLKVKEEYQELLIKVSRIEGALGIGLNPSSPNDESAPDQGLEYLRRREEEEAECIALEQLGTGGLAQGR